MVKGVAVVLYPVSDLVGALVEKGATVTEDVRDVGGGLLVAILKDAEGNMIGLRQAPLP
jgi:hypothetical protein